jgi:hypothetical protein
VSSLRALILSALSLPIACTSTEGPRVSREEACAELARALCTQASACTPARLTAQFGDLATCIARTSASCPIVFDVPFTSATPERIAQCARDITPLPCDKLSAALPASCVPSPGGLPEGTACFDDAQCESTWCARNDDAPCGKCTLPLQLGNFCVDVGLRNDGTSQKTCGRDLVCVKDTCLTPGRLGESCMSSPCAIGLACGEGFKCVPSPRVGDPCTDWNDQCDHDRGEYCHPETKVCAVVVAAAAGERCGYVRDDYKVCAAGARCIANPEGFDRCVPPAADGAACDRSKGPDCLAPAKCFNGVCMLPSATSCGTVSSRP